MTALQGIRVLELAESPAGEYCGRLLADFGADVIKLESPGRGSPTRHMGPFAPRGADPERSGLFAYLNTGKRSLELDLQSGAGRDTLQQLIGAVDAVIDDHPAGWLQSVGLDPDTCLERHPRLVLCAITPFGSSPPEDRKHAEDLNVFHSSGWGYHTPSGGDEQRPPLKGAGRFLPSYESGVEAAVCIVAALYDCEGAGPGRFIDISKQEVLASRVDYVLAQMVAGDLPVGTERTAFDLFGPAGIFPCRDGFAYIWMSAPAHWDALRQLLGDPDWMASFPENWLERECTPERVALCRQHIAAWLETQGKHEAAAAAQALGLTLVAVNDARDLQESPQYIFRRYFAEIDHPAQGAGLYPTVPYRLSETPASIASPAPLLGEHTAKTLAELAGNGRGE
jgi:crotonobetainyl-CoA:carnitine CoA-transferase CaiB-like acyl-CoA transferase